MKKSILFLLILAISIASLFSCGNKDDAPEGLQTADVSERGYIFYAPENWAVINSENVSAAKVSAINNTSVTFAEADIPSGTLPEYFDESMATLPEGIKSTLQILVRDEKCIFGNADGECLKYVYTYKYEDFDFACMQILVNHGSRFFIFTYTSYGDVNDELSDYRKYMSSVQLSIENFIFTEAKANDESVSYPKDSDGYNMVSNTKISGFELYLPESYEVVFSDAYVKAKISDGANISLSKATQTGIDIVDYLKMRKEELCRFATDFTDIAVTFTVEIPEESTIMKNWTFGVDPECNSELVFGDLDSSSLVAYEYTYVFSGTAYRVYQMMGVGNLSGYVFTYTAIDSEYQNHIEEIKTILEKVRF